jgi:hypothetical protein
VRLDAGEAETLYYSRAAVGRGVVWILLPEYRPHGPDCLLQSLAGQAVALPISVLEHALLPAYLTAPSIKRLRFMLPLGLERLALPIIPLSPDLQAECWI